MPHAACDAAPWVVAPRRITLRGGESVWLRPVEADDRRLIEANFSKVTPEEIHQRFFEYLKKVPQGLAERLTHFDHRRELALVAVPTSGDDDSEDAYGVVRLVADATGREAEYAIIVRHDWQGRGLGWELTRIALDAARARGIQAVFALVLNDNTRMIRMLREFGFALCNDQAAFGVVRAELCL